MHLLAPDQQFQIIVLWLRNTRLWPQHRRKTRGFGQRHQLADIGIDPLYCFAIREAEPLRMSPPTHQNFQKLHDRDTSKQPEPAKQEDKPQKAGYGKEQRRRRAEVRTRLKALETEIEELGAHIVELENEINDPEVLRDHLLLRDKCDELDDSRFHQQELYDEWEKLAEEQDRMDEKSDS